MHSSRMRTGRALTVFRSLLLPEGEGLLLGGGVVCSGEWGSGLGGLLPGGGVWSRGCLLPGEGVSAPRGGVCSGGGESGTPSPPVNRMNDRQV